MSGLVICVHPCFINCIMKFQCWFLGVFGCGLSVGWSDWSSGRWCGCTDTIQWHEWLHTHSWCGCTDLWFASTMGVDNQWVGLIGPVVDSAGIFLV